VVVLDVGKTLAKATLWSPERQLLLKRSRPNARTIENGLPVLDYKGIEEWLTGVLREFAATADIEAIVPVGHGASGCLVEGDTLIVPPLDYEATPPDDIRQKYLAARDAFAVTGSPCLPMGLNFGTQLFWLQSVFPDQFARGTILMWPQYWAWRLCGETAIEVTSLGCHTDLWQPTTGKPSPMAVAQGWAERFAPLRKASDVLGTVSPDWCERTGLSRNCKVLCGLHDSNAALLASRLHPEIANRECTVLSTGTWFIAMRSLPSAAECPVLTEDRDCLFNVDVWGNPVPSSRFMGGREAELLEDSAGDFVDVAANANELKRLAIKAVEDDVFALPAFEAGVGPFPHNVGSWINRPEDKLGRRAVAALYLALMANASLDLIGARGRIIIEGRFGGDPVFTQALAALRPADAIYLSNAADNLAFGALGLLDGAIPAGTDMKKVAPLEADLARYAAAWRVMVADGDVVQTDNLKGATTMTSAGIKSAYETAKQRYAALGIDTDEALKKLDAIAISIQCWQGDDVGGFESVGTALSGGIQATGNYPGKARTLGELRADAEKAISLIPGKHRFNLHASYLDNAGKKIDRDEIEPKHFQSWIDWAKKVGMGLDFNPTYFSHPKAADGFTLAHADKGIREFWIRHGIQSRKIGAEIGKQLGSTCATNFWMPDGLKDIPADRQAPRERMAASLDKIFAEKIDPKLNVDSVEAKLFGIGLESYTVGSHEFYMGYAVSRQTHLTLDSGHFHPTEVISDKISSILMFCPGLVLHVSRPVRWDSDHVVVFDDELQAIGRELVRSGKLDKVHIGLDYFDASINRVAAWVIGTRNMQKSLLMAFLEPSATLRKAELEGDFTSRLVLNEELKSLPWAAVWDYWCETKGVPVGTAWLDEVKAYERDVLSKRS
jgi:L-rhamnose isomerase